MRTLRCMQGLVSGLVLVAVFGAVAAAAGFTALRLQRAARGRDSAGGRR